MKRDSEFVIYCHFSAIGKKIVRASNFTEAKEIAESDESLHFDELVELTEHCKVDKILPFRFRDSVFDHTNIRYSNWGSE